MSWRWVSVTSGSVSGFGTPPWVSRIANGSLERRSRPRRMRSRVLTASGRSRSPMRGAGSAGSMIEIAGNAPGRAMPWQSGQP
jgi:hypothetical protein